jgi:hypothetical protein
MKQRLRRVTDVLILLAALASLGSFALELLRLYQTW